MNNASALIQRCQSLGATLTPFGDRLNVRAPQALPDDLMAALREAKPQVIAELQLRKVQPIIWHGTVDEYRSVLLIKEAELVAAMAQLTGYAPHDWYAKNRILTLEQHITDLRTWLSIAIKRAENNT